MTNKKWQYPDTTGWAQIPFEVEGVKFISALDINGNIYAQVMRIPQEIFQQMNIGAVRSTIGSVKTMTRSELQNELYRVNEGASEALILLA